MAVMISFYGSPCGRVLLDADEGGLCGLFFEGSRGFAARAARSDASGEELPVLSLTKRWLDIYFSGKEPDFLPPLRLFGTPFQREAWAFLVSVPYGETVTYGEIACMLATRREIPRMSSRAVGSAVGCNPISIIIPCHRVVATGGGLGGYAGGVDRKKMLLQLENPNKMW